MKKAFLLILLVGSFQQNHAQYVLIPDTALGSWLHDIFPSGVIGSSSSAWVIDTTSPEILSCTSLQLYNTMTIRNLSGIQYFKNVTSLSCSNDGIIHLPALPPKLQSLDCSLNYLDPLPDLPPTLVYLNCEVCNLHFLPVLPSTLRQLDC
jgi:Leucine-rich repeat (LRR) protein